MKTDSKVTKEVVEFVKFVGKESVVCRKDVPGFIVNRLFIPMAHGPAKEVDRTGASIEEVGLCVQVFAWISHGNNWLADFTGMDVMHKATFEIASTR